MKIVHFGYNYVIIKDIVQNVIWHCCAVCVLSKKNTHIKRVNFIRIIINYDFNDLARLSFTIDTKLKAYSSLVAFIVYPKLQTHSKSINSNFLTKACLIACLRCFSHLSNCIIIYTLHKQPFLLTSKNIKVSFSIYQTDKHTPGMHTYRHVANVAI